MKAVEKKIVVTPVNRTSEPDSPTEGCALTNCVYRHGSLSLLSLEFIIFLYFCSLFQAFG